MKLILTGTTGYIGAEILHQALAHKAISSVVVLTRRPLNESARFKKFASAKGIDLSDPRLKVIVLDDWTSYPESTLSELAGADACLWTLGIKPGKSPADIEKARLVRNGYTMAAVQAWKGIIKGGNNCFRFVYMSGGVEERDQQKKLWYMETYRKIGGEGETLLIESGTNGQSEEFETYITRPWIVLEGLLPALAGPFAIKLQDLAAAMIEIGIKGDKQKQTFENEDLRAIGRRARRE